MTIITEIYLYLTKGIFMLKHSVKLRRYTYIYMVQWQHIVERHVCGVQCTVRRRIIQRDVIINVERSSCKVRVIRVRFSSNTNIFFDTFSRIPQVSRFVKIHPLAPSSIPVDGRVGLTKLIVTFRKFANALKIVTPQVHPLYTSSLITSFCSYILSKSYYVPRSHRCPCTFQLQLCSNAMYTSERAVAEGGGLVFRSLRGAESEGRQKEYFILDQKV